MRKIFISLFTIVALTASSVAVAQDNTKKECCKAKTECTTEKKAETKACCADKKADTKACCADKDKKAEGKACCADKKTEGKSCCANKKATTETKSCGKK